MQLLGLPWWLVAIAFVVAIVAMLINAGHWSVYEDERFMGRPDSPLGKAALKRCTRWSLLFYAAIAVALVGCESNPVIQPVRYQTVEVLV
ncbi:hypothetical protein, partial [Streptococcus pneumoniae]|uniref:hypothetical protein n=1 Tax=Streptococcus pneumoniae TaxID=1313 RepID=UPI0018B0DDDA